MNHFLNQFFTLPRTFLQWGVELVGGVLFALAFFLLIVFSSPPLPFYSPTCATGWNDPINLFFSLVFMYLGWRWHIFTGHPAGRKDISAKK